MKEYERDRAATVAQLGVDDGECLLRYTDGCLCTLPRGHDGEHVAMGEGELHRWIAPIPPAAPAEPWTGPVAAEFARLNARIAELEHEVAQYEQLKATVAAAWPGVQALIAAAWPPIAEAFGLDPDQPDA